MFFLLRCRLLPYKTGAGGQTEETLTLQKVCGIQELNTEIQLFCVLKQPEDFRFTRNVWLSYGIFQRKKQLFYDCILLVESSNYKHFKFYQTLPSCSSVQGFQYPPLFIGTESFCFPTSLSIFFLFNKRLYNAYRGQALF